MMKIVVLDKLLQHGELLGARLKLDEHDVRVVSCGADAIDLAYLFKPDLLITNWDLKGDDYDGLEVAKAFHSANAKIKTIVFSERPSVQSVQQKLVQNDYGKVPGLIASFQKPVLLDRLADTVRHAIQTLLV